MDSRVDALRRAKASGEHLKVIQLAQEMLTTPETLTDSEGVDVARAGWASSMAMERYHQANMFAVEEQTWAAGAGDPELVAAGVYHHGTALLFLGDNSAAEERLRHYLTLDSPARPALDRYRGAVQFNLGIARMNLRDYRDAVARFMAARDAFQETGQPRGMCQAYLEAAWAELLAHRAEPAGFYLEQAMAILEEHPDEHLQAVCLCHRAFYHQALGELATAVALCTEVLTPGRPGVTAHQLSEAAWISGECAMATGQLEAARMFAALALDEAVNAKWPALMNRAGDLRRRIAQSDSQSA